MIRVPPHQSNELRRVGKSMARRRGHPLPFRRNLIGMSERTRYLPRQGYTSMPWRNGAGTTREIAREPAQAETFIWRLSLATVAVSGPFSSYRGYERAVALVEGCGFRLDIEDARTRVLATRGEYALFPGAAQTRCELIDGPCTDLSLMVREPGSIGAVARMHIGADEILPASSGMMRALFVLHGAVACRALQPSLPRCEPDAPALQLGLHDTLIIDGGADSWFLRKLSSNIAELLVIAFSPFVEHRDLPDSSGARVGAPANT
jgi:uncharacterized protein